MLEDLYRNFNKREFVHPDPLELLYGYPDVGDREIVGLVASSIAYGRVSQILRSASAVLEPMGDSPRRFVLEESSRSMKGAFRGFKHRFTTGDDISAMLLGVKRALEKHGSLNRCFLAGMGEGDATVLGALSGFTAELSGTTGLRCGFLLPNPEKGSACKRLNLFLRWLVREDDVDPGGWRGVPPSMLLVPLDTHMHRICGSLGLTSRRQPDLRAVLEVTDSFRALVPDDPVRYDFALTRFGIRDDFPIDGFLTCIDEKHY